VAIHGIILHNHNSHHSQENKKFKTLTNQKHPHIKDQIHAQQPGKKINLTVSPDSTFLA
jgi:hypothetical protein